MKLSKIPFFLLLLGTLLAGCKKEREDHVALAQQAEAAGNRTVAIQQYERAIRDQPGDLGLRERLIDLLLLESRDEQALPHLMLLVRQRRDDAPLLVKTIKLMLEFGGWKESKEYYDAAPLLVQQKPEVREIQAVLLIREARFEEAEKILAALIDDPKTPAEVVRSAKLRRGRLMHQMGRSEDALADFNSLIEKGPQDTEALLLRANLFMAGRKYEEAKAAYKGILDVNPKEYEAWLGLASLAVQEQRKEEAIQSYETALSLNPKDTDVLFWLAELHFERGEKAALLALKEKAIGRQWERELFLGYLSGLEKMEEEDFENALKEFERLRPVLAGYPGLFDKIGLCYLKVGKPTEAEIAFSKLLHDEKVQEQVWSALGRGYLSITNYARAVRWLEIARGKERLGALTQAQFGLGDLPSAYKNALLWLKEEPGSVPASLIAAEAARRLEIDEQGKAYYEQIVASEPDSPSGSYARAQLLVSSNQLAEAASLLGEQKDMVETQAGPSLLQAEISLRLGNLEEADKQLVRTLKLKPDYARAHALRGLLAKDRDDPETAAKCFSDALMADPLERIALMGQGWLSQERGDFTAAADYYEQASSLKKPEPEAALLWSLTEFASSEYKRALQAAERAVRLSPTNAFAHYLEIRGNIVNNQLDRATQQAIELGRSHPQYAPGQHALALLALSTNGFAQALGHVQQGLMLQATNLLLQPLEVELLRLTGKPHEAQTKLERLKRDFPNEPDTFFAEINLLMESKDNTGARTVVIKGLAANPKEARLQQLLLDTFTREGKEREAAPVMEAALKGDPENSALRFICARLRETREEWDLAEQHYRDILKIDPKSVATLNNLSLVVARNEKRRDEAVRLAQRAYVLDGRNPSVADTLATLLLTDGDARQAVTLLQTAQKQAPKSVTIRLHLVEALLAQGMPGEAKKEFESLIKEFPAAREHREYQSVSAKLEAGTGAAPRSAN